MSKIKRKSITLYFTESNENEMYLYNLLQNFESPLSTLNGNIKSILYEILVVNGYDYNDIFTLKDSDKGGKKSLDNTKEKQKSKVNDNKDYDFFDELIDGLG